MREREFWQIINGIRDENPRAVSHNLKLAVSGMSDDKLISFIKIYDELASAANCPKIRAIIMLLCDGMLTPSSIVWFISAMIFSGETGYYEVIGSGDAVLNHPFLMEFGPFDYGYEVCGLAKNRNLALPCSSINYNIPINFDYWIENDHKVLSLMCPRLYHLRKQFL